MRNHNKHIQDVIYESRDQQNTFPRAVTQQNQFQNINKFPDSEFYQNGSIYWNIVLPVHLDTLWNQLLTSSCKAVIFTVSTYFCFEYFCKYNKKGQTITTLDYLTVYMYADRQEN